MHILVLSDRDWTHPQSGGTGTNLYGQISRWLAWGHRVTLLCCGYRGARREERIDGLTIYRLGGTWTGYPRIVWRQLRGVGRDADVVFEVINGRPFLTPLWLRKPRVALVHHTSRGDQYVQELGRKGRIAGLLLETLPLKYLYRRSRFIAVSRSTAAHLAAYGVARDRIEVNYNGVEHAAFGPGERAPEPTLLYLGRIRRYKHIERLLDVLEELPEAVLEIAGEGNHRPALEAEIEARGLSGRVRMHGFVDEDQKRALLQRAWLNVTASSTEGWSLAVMEAAACATPSAALSVGGLPESIEHDRTGLLANDTAELARHVRRVIADPGLRERLGRAAFERARQFTWDRTARRTLAILREERAAHRLVPHERATPDVVPRPERGVDAAADRGVSGSATRSR